MKQSKIEKQGKMIDEFMQKTMLLRFHPERVTDPVNELMRCKELLSLISRGLSDDFDVLIMWRKNYKEAEQVILGNSCSKGVRNCTLNVNRYVKHIIQVINNCNFLTDEQIRDLKTEALFNIAKCSIRFQFSAEMENYFENKIFKEANI